MIQRGVHLNNHLQSIGRLASFFKVPHSHFLDVQIGIVQLCQKESERPRIRLRARANEFSEMVRGVQTNFLWKMVHYR